MRAAGRIHVVLLGVLGCGALAMVPRAHAQFAPPSSSSPSTSGRNPNPRDRGLSDDSPTDPLGAQQEARRQRAAMDERQRKMQEDTARLLKLAEELKAEMEKTNKFQMSVDVIRKAEEIEKLARDVKNRMKS